MFRFSLLLLGLGLLFSPSAGNAQEEEELPRLARLPYIQQTTQTSAVVVWRTNGPTVPFVVFGTDPANLDRLALPTQMVIRTSPDVVGPPLPRLATFSENIYQYEAYLSGLEADTKYYYAVFDWQELLIGDPEHWFGTAPEPGTERGLRFLVIGDSGNGSVAQRDAFAAVERFAQITDRPIDAFLHLGDMAYTSGADVSFGANFFGIYERLLRNTVTWPTMGNHEGFFSSGVTGIGPYYDAYVLPTEGEAGGVPSGREAFYSFDYGPVHFVCLDSHDLNRGAEGEMARWLKADLDRTKAKWLIAFWHHPPYTKGTHDSDRETQLIEMRSTFMPMLESAGVDLVLCGHSHIYERSMLIDGAYETPTVAEGVIFDDGDGDPDGDGAYQKSEFLNPNEGTVAVVAGHGRGAAASFGGRSPVMRKTVVETGSFVFDVDGDTLRGYMINSVGEVRDRFDLVKRGEVEPPEREPYPWTPFGPVAYTTQTESGKVGVDFVASPRAPDAVIRYTTDGSAPDENSPIYEGTVIVEPGTQILANTTWRDGARQSPVSLSAPLRALPDDVIHLRLRAPEDDAVELITGEISVDADVLRTDPEERSFVGLRFRGVPLPKGATVLEARLVLSPAESTIGFLANASIAVELVSSTEPFALQVGDIIFRTTTEPLETTGSWWRSDAFGSVAESPNVALQVQAALDHEGWEEGNALGFVLSALGPRSVHSFEGDPSRAAQLFLTYTQRDLVELSLETELAFRKITNFEGSETLLFTHRQLEHAEARGLRYEIETSQTLDQESWERRDVVPFSTLSEGVGWEITTRGFVLRESERRGPFFARLRVTREAVGE